MSASHDQASSQTKARTSLIVPLAPGQTISARQVIEYREAIDGDPSGNDSELEVILAALGRADGHPSGDRWQGDLAETERPRVVTVNSAPADGHGWICLARAGLDASTGEHLIVMDLRRGYSPDSLARVAGRLRGDDWDLAVGIPPLEDAGFFAWLQLRFGLGLVSRLFLGTSDIFSGLFAVRRSVWDHHMPHSSAGKASLILELLSRHRVRCIDIRVPGGSVSRPRGVGFSDLRPLKHLLDLRFGNYSRLIQFCVVGASGMVIDLTCYAFFQWLFSLTTLHTLKSAPFGVSWHLALARALSIAIALAWNFTFNRRLTFNDARKSRVARQFLKYALTNGVAIAFNFSVSLYLPGKIGFFARHKLAAAVVAIVAATGISFSMTRWLVFVKKSEPRPPHEGTHERRRIQASTVL
jgi:dolichol-phosphate mannosyltransferase